MYLRNFSLEYEKEKDRIVKADARRKANEEYRNEEENTGKVHTDDEIAPKPEEEEQSKAEPSSRVREKCSDLINNVISEYLAWHEFSLVLMIYNEISFNEKDHIIDLLNESM